MLVYNYISQNKSQNNLVFWNAPADRSIFSVILHRNIKINS